MSREEVWANQDGLTVGFGTRDETFTGSSRQDDSTGSQERVSMVIRGEDLEDIATSAEDQLRYGVTIPAGAYVESAILEVVELFVGVGAVLDVGTHVSETLVIDDDDSLIAAVAVGSLTLGDTVTGAGAYINTILAGPVVVAASYDTAAFTAGEAHLTVVYRVPVGS